MLSTTLDDLNVIAKAPSAEVPAEASAADSATAAYAPRAIEVTIGLTSGGGGTNVKLTGLRVETQIAHANMPTTGLSVTRVYGLTLDHMNALSKAGQVYSAATNTILIEAGDQGTKLTPVFAGNILEAYPDFRAQPEVFFYIFATPTPIAQLKPVPPVSFNGPTQASTVLEKIAQSAGWKLENNNVNAVLQSPYFAGFAWTQLLACVKAAGCFGYLDPLTKTVAVWPKLGSRNGANVEISPDTGMIGYPSFQAKIVTVRTLFDPRPKVGQPITIKSQLTAANGKFNVIDVTHDLACQTVDGPWETTVSGSPLAS